VRTDYPNDTWNNESYEYNGSQVIKKTYTKHNSVSPKYTLYQWVDGNLASITEPDGDVIYYTWNTSELFQQGDYFGLIDLELGYATVRPKNRIKSLTTNNGVLFEISHSEDSDGKVKSIHVDPTVGNDYNVSVKYECD
jgi:hypothetical protein